MYRGQLVEQDRDLLHAQQAVREADRRPEDEVLAAIEFLEAVPMPQTVELLQCALEASQPERLSRAAGARGARANRVALRAARALARIEHPEGPWMLVHMLSTRTAPAWLRETAACGMGGVVKAVLFGGLAAALMDPEPSVRRAGLLSAQQTFDNLQGRRFTEMNAVIAALAAYVLVGERDEGSALAWRLLKRHRTPAAERYLEAVLLTSADGAQCALALDLLRELAPNAAGRVFAACLAAQDRPPGLYRRLAELPGGFEKAELVATARRVAGEKLLLLKLRMLLSPRLKEGLLARRAAAQAILALK